MTHPFSWKPSEIPEGSSVMAVCVRPDCGGHRYLPRSYLIEKAGNVPLSHIEKRLRCVERPRLNRRGPACRGNMTLQWVPTPVNDLSSLMDV